VFHGDGEIFGPDRRWKSKSWPRAVRILAPRGAFKKVARNPHVVPIRSHGKGGIFTEQNPIRGLYITPLEARELTKGGRDVTSFEYVMPGFGGW